MVAPTKTSFGVTGAAVLARANQTGEQAISTITGLQAALDGKASAILSGSWTPALAGGTTPGTPTYTTREGYYTRIGNIVVAQAYLVISGVGGAVGTATITGLPFSLASGTGKRAPFNIAFWSGITLPAGSIHLVGFFQSGTVIQMQRWTVSSGGTALAISDLTAPTTIYGTVTYEAA
ncbi:hypothetical protein [Allomesorhizobium alhagi]|uniref:hypothetical protein n=1 Tax=Allomesorhizobium alhagi TaxID=475067 RepID=UPI0011126DA1|nr:hypothetical protein [Mesorhizobium alhagi]